MPQSRRREVGAEETIAYLQTMLGELAALARAQRLDLLAYLIEVAHLEATAMHSRSVRDQGDEAAGKPVKPAGKVNLQ